MSTPPAGPTTPAPATTPRAALAVVFDALSIDLLVYGIAIPVLPRLAAVTDAGPSAAGLLFACYAAALIAVTPLVGWWVDRAGPRVPLLAGLLGLGVTTAVFTAGGPLGLLVAARLAQGAAAALSWVAGLALIAAVTPLGQRGRNMGLVLSGVSVGTCSVQWPAVYSPITSAPPPRFCSPPPSPPAPGSCNCV